MASLQVPSLEVTITANHLNGTTPLLLPTAFVRQHLSRYGRPDSVKLVVALEETFECKLRWQDRGTYVLVHLGSAWREFCHHCGLFPGTMIVFELEEEYDGGPSLAALKDAEGMGLSPKEFANNPEAFDAADPDLDLANTSDKGLNLKVRLGSFFIKFPKEDRFGHSNIKLPELNYRLVERCAKKPTLAEEHLNSTKSSELSPKLPEYHFGNYHFGDTLLGNPKLHLLIKPFGRFKCVLSAEDPEGPT